MRRLTSLAIVSASLALAACGGEEAPEEAPAGGAGGGVEVVLTDFALEPSSLSLEPGSYTMRVVNEGESTHALKVDGPGGELQTGEIAPGGSAELALDLSAPGQYELTCPVGDHRERGMEGTLTVGDGGGGGTTPEEPTTEDDEDGYLY